MANQISNESLLSKTDMFESQLVSNTALRPKFSTTTSPFLPLEAIKDNKTNGSKNGSGKNFNKYRDNNRRRRRKKPKELIEAAIQKSQGSKEATIMLETFDSREGVETM